MKTNLLVFFFFFFFINLGNFLRAQENKNEISSSNVEDVLKKYKEDIHFEKNKGQLQDGILYRSKSPLSHIRFKENGVSFGIVEILEPEQNPIDLEDKHENGYEGPLRKQQEIRKAKSVKAYEPNHQLEEKKDILPQNGFVWNLNFIGANTSKQVVSKYATSNRINYFRGGSLSTADITNVKSYKELWYEGIYDGIDLRFYSKGGGEMEYDYIVYPSGSIKDIAFEMEGVEHLYLAPDGDIILKTPLGDVRKSAPYTYQVIDGVEVEVNSKYVLEDGVISFALEEDYNRNYPLIIDPTLIRYATFFGGSNYDYMSDIKADADGNVYLTGYARSTDFPTTTGAFQTTKATGTNSSQYDAVLFKLDPSGNPVFATYLGGNDYDYGFNLELDATGVYVNGRTRSPNFPTTSGAYMETIPCRASQPNCTSYSDLLFISKFTLDGSSLIYSTFLGGSEYEYNPSEGRGSALYNGEVYVMGETYSYDTAGTQYPLTTNPYMDWAAASQIVTSYDYYYYGYTYTYYNQYTYFITRLNSTGTGLVASTLFKLGYYFDNYQIEVDPRNGDAIFTSRDYTQDSWYSGSINAPITPNAYDTTISINEYPSFIVRMNSSLSTVTACTYFNNDDDTWGTSPRNLLVDNGGNVYLVGNTDRNIPTTAGAFMPVRPTNINTTYDDLFVVKFDPDLEEILYGTYIGGDNNDYPNYAYINASGEVLISGYTNSADYPVTDCAWQEEIGKSTSGTNRTTSFITKLNSTGSDLAYSSYYGKNSNQFRIAEGGDGAIYLTENLNHYNSNNTNSAYNYPVTVDAFQTTGGQSLSSYTRGPYVAKLIFDVEIGENYLDTLYQEACQNADPYEITGSDPFGDVVGGSVPDIFYEGQILEQLGNSEAFSMGWEFSIDSINWSAIPGSIKKNYQPQPTSLTTYFRRVVVEECSNISDTTEVFTLYINEYLAPTVDIGDPQSICENGSAVLGGSPTASDGSSSTYTYNWLPDIGLDNANIANPTSSPTGSSVYALQVLDGNGCDVRRQTIVTVATADAGASQGICADNLVGVQIGSPPVPKNPPFVYTWTPALGLSDANIAQPIANPSDTTLYTVSITGADGCPSVDSVLVYRTETLIDAGIDKFVCRDDITTLGTTGLPNYAYQWSSPYEQYTYGIPSMPSNPLTNPIITVYPQFMPVDSLNPVPFYLKSTDLLTGCSTLDTVYVEVNPRPYALNKCFALDSTLESTGADSIALGDTLYLAHNQPAGFFDASFTYSWSPTTGVSDPTAANPYIIVTGYSSHTVTVSAPGGCDTTAIVAVSQTCFTACPLRDEIRFCTDYPGQTVDLSFTVEPVIGYCELENLTYQWESGEGLTDTVEHGTNANPNVTITTTASPGQNTTYRCIVRDTVDNLLGVYTFFVSVPDTSLHEAGSDQTICAGDTIDIGGSPVVGYRYTWAPDDSTLSNIGVSEPAAYPFNTTTYYLEMEQLSTGCFVYDTMNVFVRTPIIDAGPDVNFCGGSTFQLGSPAAPGQTYNWEPNIGLQPSGNVAQPSIELQVSLSFILTTTDTLGGCSLTDTVTLTKIEALGAEAGDDGIHCAGDTDGFQLGPDSTGTGFNYTWLPASSLDDPLSTNPTATPDQTTLYIVYVTHPNQPGCNATDQVLVTVFPPPTVTVSDKEICLGESVDIGPTPNGSMSYYWQPALGLTPADSTTVNPSVAPTETTTYDLTVTDANGCSSDAALTVSVDIPTAEAGTDIGTCQGGDGIEIGAGSTPGYSYSWNPTTDLDDATASNPTANPNINTTYTLTVTNDITGCSSTDEVDVSVLNGPVADAGSDDAICASSGGLALGTSDSTAFNYTYSWSPSTGLNNASSPTPIADPSATTTYVLTVTNTLLPNCPSTSEVEVTINATPVLAAMGGEICAGESVTIGETSQSGLTYSWSPMTDLDDAAASNPEASPSTTTNYTLTATDDNTNCMSSMSVQVIVNNLPVAIAGEDEEVCQGASATIGFGGGEPNVTYSWSPTTGLADASASQTLVTPTADTDYILTASNSVTGCETSDTVSVTLNSSATPTFSVSSEVVCLGEDVVIGPSGLTGVSYSWSPATGLDDATSENPTATVNNTTSYILTVIDDVSGCSDTAHATVTVNSLPSVNAGADQPLCPSATDGVQIGEESTTGYSYSWDPTTDLDDATLANPTAQPTATTTYTVTVTDDATGCEATDDVIVTIQQTEPDFTLTDETICESSNTLIGPSGLTGVSYEWSPNTELNSTTIAQPTASPSSTTTYSLTVTDIVTGCATTEEVEVEVLIPVVDAGRSSYSLCTGETVDIGSASEPGYTYSWTPTTGLNDASLAMPTVDISAGPVTYTLIATSPEGCEGIDETIVNYNTITADAGANQVICQQASVQIGTPALPNYDYFWSPTTGLDDATIAEPTATVGTSGLTYTMTVRNNANGCIATDEVIVGVVSIPAPSAEAGSDIILCEGETAILGAPPTQADSGNTYAWSPTTNLNNPYSVQPTIDLNSLTSTTTIEYTLTVSNADGCSNTDKVSITRVVVPANAGPDRYYCYDANGIGSTNTNALDFGSHYDYSWSPADNLNNANVLNPSANPSSATTYTLTVTDSTGCTMTDEVVIGPDTLNPYIAEVTDGTICTGDVINIGGAALPGITYDWFPTTLDDRYSANPLANPMSNTNYRLISRTENGCQTTLYAYVTVLPTLTANAGADATVCDGSGAVNIGANTNTPGVSYSWNPPLGLSDPSSPNPTALPSLTTNYTLTVSVPGSSCTPATDQVRVSLASLPTANGGGDVTFCEGTGAIIGDNGQPGYSYNWTPSTGLLSASSAQTIANPSDTTTYVLTVTYDNTGCSNTDTVIANVQPQDIASLSIDDYCAGTAPSTADIGMSSPGAYVLNPDPMDGTMIDGTTGVITGGVAGTTYRAQYITSGVCPALATDEFNIIAVDYSDNPSLTMESLCIGESSPNATLSGIAGGGTFSFNPPATDGAQIDANLGTISNPGNGASYTVEYVTSGLCPVTVNTTLLAYDCSFSEGEIGDYVWLDTNGDGIQDVGEMGIGGVGVVVIWHGGDGVVGTADDVVYTALTDGNGYYSVPNLSLGDYTVMVFTGSGTPVEAYVPTTPLVQTTNLSILDSIDLDRDFGFNPVSVSGTIWYDTDINGLEDGTEQQTEGVTVTLWDASTNMLTSFTTTTDSLGFYQFDGVPDGNYFVVVDVPSGYGVSPETIGGSTIADIPTNGVAGSTSMFTVAGQDVTDIDGGLTGFGEIGDYVWLDENGDGVQDPSETGIEGVTVTAEWYGPDGMPNTGDEETFTTVTDTSGNYLFEDIPMGDYEVELTGGVGTPLEGLTSTTGGETQMSNLTPTDPSDLDVDFGYNSVDVGNTVWYDLNGDGMQDPNEGGVEGVTVSLWDATTNTPTSFTMATDSNGMYLFTGVPPGDYYVVFDIPSGYDASPETVGGSMIDDSQTNGLNSTGTFTVGMMDNLAIDAGIVGTGSIGDYVWNDINSDGIQDGGELGIGGVGVTAIWYGPDGVLGTSDDVDYIMMTDGNGNYLFEDLPLGDYEVVVTDGAGSVLDGSTSTTGGNTQMTTLTDAAPNDLDRDFGYNSCSGVELFVGMTSGAVEVCSGNAEFYTVTEANQRMVTLVYQWTVTNGTVISGGGPFDNNITVDWTTSGTGTIQVIGTNVNGCKDTLFTEVDVYTCGSISGTSFYDIDADGSSMGDNGLDSVIVILYDSNGNPLDTLLTDSNGAYSFEDLFPGSYYVEFMTPDGFVITIPDVTGSTASDNSDATTDSDILDESSNAPGRTGTYVIDPNGSGKLHYQDVNAGYYLDTNPDLPIELTYFKAFKDGEVSQLVWVTETELNNDYFLVERSADNQVFETIASVDGAGTTSLTQDYKLTDSRPFAGINYYRLKQVDFDGSYTYSEVRTVTFEIKIFSLSVKPNPVVDKLTIDLGQPLNQDATIQVYDILGRYLLLEQQLSTGASIHEINISHLAPATYLIRIRTNELSATKRFIKMTK